MALSSTDLRGDHADFAQDGLGDRSRAPLFALAGEHALDLRVIEVEERQRVELP